PGTAFPSRVKKKKKKAVPGHRTPNSEHRDLP
ncbi:MAG: hypothetical protein QOD33_587, partial [Pyrinomonadaceae bacterium]|nr:hypothetical protein [Pyrinomonadaceae bacterium]